MSTSIDESQSGLNCMEVWGGNGSGDEHLVRPGLDIWISSRTQGRAKESGSDLHLLSSCASGRITRMLLADVCGQGKVFGEIAGEMRELLKQNINSIKQERFVNEVSQRLHDASAHGGFASTLISTYFAPTRSLSLCNTGHPAPLVFRVRDSSWAPLKQIPSEPGSEADWGVVAPDDYQKFETNLNDGDLVMSFSNSLTECRNSEGRLLGSAGFQNLVEGLDTTDASQMTTQLMQEIGNLHPENLKSEDATILLCQATSTGAAWSDTLLAPFRLFGKVSDRTQLG